VSIPQVVKSAHNAARAARNVDAEVIEEDV
jgi:hypothetical protein